MSLTVPTWLLYLFLGIASFAPVASLWPGWWTLYYSGLLICWVLLSFAAMRRLARERRQAKQRRARMLRQLRWAQDIETSKTDVDAAAQAPSESHRLHALFTPADADEDDAAPVTLELDRGRPTKTGG